MTKKQRADHVLVRLAELYPDPPIPLDHKDPYTLLVAVLLSAQCTDARVNLVTPHLFALADAPEGMAEVPVEKILGIVKPVAWAQKAKAISELSKIIVREHSGKVPDTLDALEKLPGVGHKTAQVSWLRPSGCRVFQWTLTFTDWPNAGGSLQEALSPKRSGI
nr:hypothetical protein [Verrucomicrobium spinosum]